MYSFNTIIKVVCKRNGELKNKTFFIRSGESFICCYNQQMLFIKSKVEGRAPQTHYWARWPIHITVLKMKVIYYMLQVPTRQCQNDIYFFACFVIIPLGGVTGLVAFGFFFSAGFKICKDSKECIFRKFSQPQILRFLKLHSNLLFRKVLTFKLSQ